MMDLTAGERTYSYAVSSVAPGTEASGFPFVDSSGGRIKCNYAKVMVHYDYGGSQTGGEKDHALVWIEPSGPNQLTAFSMVDDSNIAQEYTTEEIAAGNVSGVFGQCVFAAVNTPGVAEFKCDNGAIMDSVNMKVEDHPFQATEGVITIELVYGNITPFNTLRQDRYDRGA
jgi:hypothetical protein